jgi:hypothetical protein
MNEPNFEEHANTSDPKGSVLAGSIQQKPLGRGFVAVEPMDDAIVHETPLSDTVPYNLPEAEAIVLEGVISTDVGSEAALLNHEVSELFRTRWNEIQGKFVDEPRSAVQQADALVADVIEKLTQMFANEHSSLEEQWEDGNDVSTEDLRRTLQHYRSFFNRLVA